MAYIKETISSNGDRTDFAKALRDFFLNNTLAPFELISEDYTTDAFRPTFEVARNNLKIKFVVGASSSKVEVGIYAKTGDDTYAELINDTLYYNTGETSNIAMYRSLQLCLIKNEETTALYIASYNSSKFYLGSIIIDTQLTSGENLIAGAEYSSSISTIALKEVVSQLAYTARPFHTGSPDEATLILSNQLAVNGSNGVYCGDSIGLKSAGGAKIFGTYVTDSGTYFSIMNDVVIPLGDRVEYTSEVSL